jgi:hypothetical protein
MRIERRASAHLRDERTDRGDIARRQQPRDKPRNAPVRRAERIG